MLYSDQYEKHRERSKEYYLAATKKRREAMLQERTALEEQLYDYIQRNADLQAIFERLQSTFVTLETPHGERLRAARTLKKEAPTAETTAATPAVEADELME